MTRRVCLLWSFGIDWSQNEFSNDEVNSRLPMKEEGFRKEAGLNLLPKLTFKVRVLNRMDSLPHPYESGGECRQTSLFTSKQ